MDGVIFPWSVGATVPRAALAMESCAVLLSLAVYVWVRVSSGSGLAKADAGLWLMVANSAGIAPLETGLSFPSEHVGG